MLDIDKLFPLLHSCQMSQQRHCAAIHHRHRLGVQLIWFVAVRQGVSVQGTVSLCVPVVLGGLLFWGIKHAK